MRGLPRCRVRLRRAPSVLRLSVAAGCIAGVGFFSLMSGSPPLALHVATVLFFFVLTAGVLLGPILGCPWAPKPEAAHGARDLACARILFLTLYLLHRVLWGLPPPGPAGSTRVLTGVPRWLHEGVHVWSNGWLDCSLTERRAHLLAVGAAMLGVAAQPALLLAALLELRANALQLTRMLKGASSSGAHAAYSQPFVCVMLILSCAYLTAGIAKLTDCEHDVSSGSVPASGRFWAHADHLRNLMWTAQLLKCNAMPCVPSSVRWRPLCTAEAVSLYRWAVGAGEPPRGWSVLCVLGAQHLAPVLRPERLPDGALRLGLFSAVLWECGMWYAVLRPGPARTLALAVGFLFHQSVLWTLNIDFGLLADLYLLFLPWPAIGRGVCRALRRCRRRCRRLVGLVCARRGGGQHTPDHRHTAVQYAASGDADAHEQLAQAGDDGGGDATVLGMGYEQETLDLSALLPARAEAADRGGTRVHRRSDSRSGSDGGSDSGIDSDAAIDSVAGIESDAGIDGDGGIDGGGVDGGKGESLAVGESRSEPPAWRASRVAVGVWTVGYCLLTLGWGTPLAGYPFSTFPPFCVHAARDKPPTHTSVLVTPLPGTVLRRVTLTTAAHTLHLNTDTNHTHALHANRTHPLRLNTDPNRTHTLHFSTDGNQAASAAHYALWRALLHVDSVSGGWQLLHRPPACGVWRLLVGYRGMWAPALLPKGVPVGEVREVALFFSRVNCTRGDGEYAVRTRGSAESVILDSTANKTRLRAKPANARNVSNATSIGYAGRLAKPASARNVSNATSIWYAGRRAKPASARNVSSATSIGYAGRRMAALYSADSSINEYPGSSGVAGRYSDVGTGEYHGSSRVAGQYSADSSTGERVGRRLSAQQYSAGTDEPVGRRLSAQQYSAGSSTVSRAVRNFDCMAEHLSSPLEAWPVVKLVIPIQEQSALLDPSRDPNEMMLGGKPLTSNHPGTKSSVAPACEQHACLCAAV